MEEAHGKIVNFAGMLGERRGRGGLAAALALAIGCGAALVPSEARAFCGFYVGGAGARMYNHATEVVLMRDGTRTVLSMQNNYEGPPDRFAMVVPVPIVLQKENVKTLSKEMFERIDALDAPRLVEYWEADPCGREEYGYEFSDDPLASGGFGPNDATMRAGAAPPVQVLNRFSVGEYQIVILGAQDALALDAWLRNNGYAIPAGAEAVLRPYVQSGMKFFVAKVDPAKVRFERGMATLSPLRFHYDAETFNLPIRLGLLSSAGEQDLIVHILARGQRYEAANYDNVFIPTNLDVKDAAKAEFGAFYAALFDRARARKEGQRPAVVTEYAWESASCDPCVTSPLDPADLAAFGEEVLPPEAKADGKNSVFVLTRMHARYDKESLGEDLIFRAAPPVVGGREIRGAGGALEQGASPSEFNNFQARYAIRHGWSGPITCEKPRRGVWGNDPSGTYSPPAPARKLAFAPRGSVDLESFFGPGLPTSSWAAPVGARYALPNPAPPQTHGGGCAGCRVGREAREGDAGGEAGALALAVTSLLAAAAMRRRSR
jgi:hypothetical protein